MGSTGDRVRQADFEVIAESIPHIVWMADGDGSTDYFNRMGTDYTGLPPQANYGWGWVELVHPDDSARARLGWEHATRTITPFALRYRIRRYDGDFRWHAFRALPVRGADGEILKWIGTANDLDAGTGEQRHAEYVQQQANEIRTLLETVQPVESQRFGFVAPDVRKERVDAALEESRDADNAPSPTAPAADRLMAREVAVLRLLAAGYTNVEMANLMGLSLRSIEGSRSQLREALGLRTRAQLVRFAYENGLAGPSL